MGSASRVTRGLQPAVVPPVDLRVLLGYARAASARPDARDLCAAERPTPDVHRSNVAVVIRVSGIVRFAQPVTETRRCGVNQRLSHCKTSHQYAIFIYLEALAVKRHHYVDPLVLSDWIVAPTRRGLGIAYIFWSSIPETTR